MDPCLCSSVVHERPVEVIESTVTESREERMEVGVEMIMVQVENPPPPTVVEQTQLQPIRERDDDWFVLLDVVPRELIVISPGISHLPVSKAMLSIPILNMINVTNHLSSPKHNQCVCVSVCVGGLLTNRIQKPDVCLRLCLVVPEERVQASRAATETVSVVETVTIERRTQKKVHIVDESFQTESPPVQRSPPSERREGDDWFVLFEAVRDQPTVVPPGNICKYNGTYCKTRVSFTRFWKHSTVSLPPNPGIYNSTKSFFLYGSNVTNRHIGFP